MSDKHDVDAREILTKWVYGTVYEQFKYLERHIAEALRKTEVRTWKEAAEYCKSVECKYSAIEFEARAAALNQEKP